MVSPILSLNQVLVLPPPVIYCDVRYTVQHPNGSEAFAEGHIPGARYVSMDHVLAAPAGPIVGRHPLPTPEHFATQMGKLGIDNQSTVIAYDAHGGRFAGRLVWMLRVIGQPAALLDGGLDAWKNHPDSIPLETGIVNHAPVNREVIAWPDSEMVDADQVAQAIAGGVTVFDSRDPQRYRGEVEPLDKKAGHIPGAKNFPFGKNYQDGGNSFQSLENLRQQFEQAGVESNSIFYCGSGVTACNNILAAEAAGFPRPRLYVGSWSGWSSDDRPVATGE